MKPALRPAIRFTITTTSPLVENFYTGTASAASVPVHSPSLGLITGNMYDAYGRLNPSIFTLTATFGNLIPFQPYDAYAFGLWWGGPNSQTVTITSASGSVSFVQQGGDLQLYVNGSVGSSSQNLEAYASLAVSDASGNIAITYRGLAGILVPSGVALESATPEPATWSLALLALAAAAFMKAARPKRHTP